MTKPFNAKTLSEVIVKALGLKPGDDVEIQVDRLDPSRVLVRRHMNEGSSA
jgi:antitoxin component of MazEF toxin-antitoxin module